MPGGGLVKIINALSQRNSSFNVLLTTFTVTLTTCLMFFMATGIQQFLYLKSKKIKKILRDTEVVLQRAECLQNKKKHNMSCPVSCQL